MLMVQVGWWEGVERVSGAGLERGSARNGTKRAGTKRPSHYMESDKTQVRCASEYREAL